MATLDPGHIPGTFSRVANKLQSQLNYFREVIEGKKMEIRKVSKEMRSLIKIKENNLIQELDGIWEEVNARMTKWKARDQKKIKTIKRKGKEMEKIFQEIRPNSGPLIDISDEIDSVKREVEISIPYVKLTWGVDELENSIEEMCHCEQQIIDYKEISNFRLKWSNCEGGIQDYDLSNPWSLAVHPMNENIYVADSGNHRLQILSKDGYWTRSVTDGEMRNPQNLLFLNKSLYVQCISAIMKLNVSTELKEIAKSFDVNLRGVCTDGAHIFVGEWLSLKLIVLTLDLIQENKIALTREFCRQGSRMRDISLSQDQFYVLISETEYPIQLFSKKGVLTKCLLTKGGIIGARCFCLDQQHNIIVADDGDSKVKIFSNEGNLLTQFGVKGPEVSKFQSLVGVSVDETGSITTVQQRGIFLLQQFTLFY